MGVYFALAVVLVVLLVSTIAEILLLDAYATVFDRLNRDVFVPPGIDQILARIPMFATIEYTAALGLHLCVLPIILLTTRQTTRLQHQAVRLLVPMIAAYIIVWIGQKYIFTAFQLMAGP